MKSYAILVIFACIFSPVAVAAQAPAGQLTDTTRLWTEEDRRYLISALQANMDSVLHFVEKLTPAQWSFHESPNRWSVAEVCEHLDLYEFAYFREVISIANLPLPDQQYLSFTRNNDDFYIRYETDTTKATASRLMEPIGRYPSKDKWIESFVRARNAFINFIRATGKDFRRMFVFRNFTAASRLTNPTKWNIRDLHQLVLTDIAHVYRHLHQMEAVMRTYGKVAERR